VTTAPDELADPGRPDPQAVEPPPTADAHVGRFDRWVDNWFEAHLRNRTAPDVVFYLASAVGDHGILWMGLAGAQAIRRRCRGATVDEWRRPLVRAVTGLAIESALVNGPVKWLFPRKRPVFDGPRPRHLRQPRTSSFPSGHASAAFFAAALLRDDDPWWPLYYAVGAVVAASRVYVRIHHASDVVGGAVLGVALGELARALGPLHSPARGQGVPARR
jgi:undecaprenyl-diphosphatase